MDRTSSSSSSTQTATPFSYEAMPNEIHTMILDRVDGAKGGADRPTLRSVSCVDKRLHSLAMPFLMECYVSLMEIALPAFSSEKKVHKLLELKSWMSRHVDQMPTMACVDAFHRIEKLTNTLTAQELQLFVAQYNPSSPAPDNPPISVNQMIAMQMSISSACQAFSNLGAHYRQLSAKLDQRMSSD